MLGIAASVGGGWWIWNFLHQPYQGYSGKQQIDIRPGRSATSILQELAGAGVLPDVRLARLFLIHALKDPPLQAGEYHFDKPLNTPQVLTKLIHGVVVTYPITLIEGLTLEESAEAIVQAGFGELDVLLREMGRAELIAELDQEAEDLEGYLYPDTYNFARGTSEAEIIATLVNTFKKRFRAEVEPLLENYQGTVRELVTLASIVEKETQVEDERPVIAGLYQNRLRIRMPLQADPTVIFAFKKLGTWDGNLRRPDLKFDSPYNTYVYPGLPPGPICSSRAASLVAAAAPAQTPYFYFVSRNDGTHVFARTYAEHRRNVNQWQKLYWRKKWAEERAGR
jgi:UPF0755 protein